MRKILLSLVIVVVSCTSTLSGMARGVDSTLAGVSNFGRVNDHLCRGAQPEGEGIKSLAELGVRTIIDLRAIMEVSAGEEARARAAGIIYTNVPMSGLGRPTDEQVEKVLLLIEKSAGPVFIHCQHGADRTGTIVACYRIKEQKWTSKRALKEARRYGMSWLEIGMKHYIVAFEKSHKGK